MDRAKIINEYSKSEFMDFLENDNSGLILTLFNDEGINIIKNSKLKEERISYILNYSSYKNELFLNISFVDMFLNSDISYYYASLNSLNYKAYNNILKRSAELNKSPNIIAQLFSYFNIIYKLNIISDWAYSNEVLYYILKIDAPSVVQKIISTYNIDLLSHDIDLRSFFNKAKEANLSARSKRNNGELNAVEIEVPPPIIKSNIFYKIL